MAKKVQQEPQKVDEPQLSKAEAIQAYLDSLSMEVAQKISGADLLESVQEKYPSLGIQKHDVGNAKTAWRKKHGLASTRQRGDAKAEPSLFDAEMLRKVRLDALRAQRAVFRRIGDVEEFRAKLAEVEEVVKLAGSLDELKEMLADDQEDA